LHAQVELGFALPIPLHHRWADYHHWPNLWIAAHPEQHLKGLPRSGRIGNQGAATESLNHGAALALVFVGYGHGYTR
jgi:hypothetical protein